METIGKGGMATVYKGYDVVLRRTCALKVLNVKFAREERAVTQFFTEARLARRLEHPHIIRTYDFGRTDVGYLYIAMELLQGQTLSRVLRGYGPMEEERALRLFAQILAALKAAHDRGTVHRDLKPENIFLCGEGENEYIKLLDFGIAQFSGTTSFSGREVCGTPAYMSPEQIRGKPATPASDLYSAGLVLFEMLTGTQAFTGPSPVEILKRQLKMPPPPLPEVAPGLHKVMQIWELMQQMLKKKLKDRLSDAGEALERLRAIWPVQEVEVRVGSGVPESVPLPHEGVRVPVFSYQAQPARPSSPAISLGLVSVSSSREVEEVLVEEVRPRILLEEGAGVGLDGDCFETCPSVGFERKERVDSTTRSVSEWGFDHQRSAPRIHSGGVNDPLVASGADVLGGSNCNHSCWLQPRIDPFLESAPVRCTCDTYTLVHVRFVGLDRRQQGPAYGEQIRRELGEELEPWFALVERLGGLVCHDSGADIKVLFGYLTDEEPWIASALEAAMALSILVEHQAIAQGKPWGVKVGVATGSVYMDENVDGPLDWVIRGSEIEFAVRLSRIAPAGGVVMCQSTALLAQPRAVVREMASVSVRGRGKVPVFLLVSMAPVHEMPLPELSKKGTLDPIPPFEYVTRQV